MSKVLKVWCDSGANAFSCFKTEVPISEFGLTDEEWDGLTDDQKDKYVKDVAWQRLEWGYTEK